MNPVSSILPPSWRTLLAPGFTTRPSCRARACPGGGSDSRDTHFQLFATRCFCASKRAGPDFGHYPSIRPIVSASFPHLAGLVSSRGSRVRSRATHLVFVHHCLRLSHPFLGCSSACRHLLTQARSSSHRILISRDPRRLVAHGFALVPHLVFRTIRSSWPEPPIPWMLHVTVLRVV